MLFSLFATLVDTFSFLNVFKYLTFRTGLSVITSLIVVFLIGGPLIELFSKNQITGPIRQDGPIDHIIKKSGTPTMGGIIIVIGIVTSTLLWADLSNIFIWTLIFVLISLISRGLRFFIVAYLSMKFGNEFEILLKKEGFKWFSIIGIIIVLTGLIFYFYFKLL